VDQIVELVTQRAGISGEQARTAVEVVVNEIKKRLPDPIAGQVDAALGGAAGNDNPLGGLGGMLGR
jgi:uncharacterized protein (DUF2267 family)